MTDVLIDESAACLQLLSEAKLNLITKANHAHVVSLALLKSSCVTVNHSTESLFSGEDV